MSNDEGTTNDLIQTLEDGREGFSKGAEKLEQSNRPEFAATFRRFAEQRSRYSDELAALAHAYGYEPRESGSLAGTLHRGWMSLKDALTGSDPDGVLDAAEQGEDHAIKEYEKALGSEISPQLRIVIERQARDVTAAHDEVNALRNSQS